MMKKTSSKLTVIALLAGLAVTAHAGIGTELKQAFDEMSYQSSPQEFATVDRKGYWGGSYQMRSRVVNLQLAQAQLPSVKAGCGGINMTGGSFSFVNQDQLVQLFRQVASNAKGYAFQLAMDAACPSCTKWMNEFQAKIQAMTSHTANSCQLAQGIVNVASDVLTPDSMDARLKAAQVDSGLEQSWKNVDKDFWAAVNYPAEAGKPWATPLEKEKSTAPDAFAMKHGNVLWNAMVKAKVNRSFSVFLTNGAASAPPDYNMMQQIVSMTDTIMVIDGKDKDNEGSSAPTNPLKALDGVDLKTLVMAAKGAKIKVYNCVGNKGDTSAAALPPEVQDAGFCLIADRTAASAQVEVTLQDGGLAELIRSSFIGDGTTTKIGLIDSLSDYNGKEAPDERTLTYMKQFDPAIIEAVRMYARFDMKDQAKELINTYSNRLALDTVKSMIDTYYNYAIQTLNTTDSTQKLYVPAQVKLIKEARAKLQKDYETLLLDNKTFPDLADAADRLEDAQRKLKLLQENPRPGSVGAGK